MFGIDDAIASVSSLADSVVKRIWPDATEIEKAKIEQVTKEMQAEFTLLLGQIEINKIEAQGNWFSSGWRPFVGWTCGFSLAYSAILEPFLRFIATVVFNYSGQFPIIDTTITLQILLAMLGFGAMRSMDKHLGTARK